VLTQDKVKALLSSEHFSVDGTLLEAWASLKSFRPKDGSGEPPDLGRNGERDFHGERRRNDTHASSTDPDARLFRKGPGKEARLCFMGHALMENRNGLIVGATTTTASGRAERQAALSLIESHANTPPPVTLGTDKGYDSADFVRALRGKAVVPHVAQNTSGRRSAIDGRTTGHLGYALSARGRQPRSARTGADAPPVLPTFAALSTSSSATISGPRSVADPAIPARAVGSAVSPDVPSTPAPAAESLARTYSAKGSRVRTDTRGRSRFGFTSQAASSKSVAFCGIQRRRPSRRTTPTQPIRRLAPLALTSSC
jgi:Transposase DDE domain